jgi:DNA-binding transcriptional regulator YiaG
MKSSFTEQLGPQVRIRDIDPVHNGSPARLSLVPKAGFSATVPIARALMRRGVKGRLARGATERLLRGEATPVAVPHFDGPPLIRELSRAGVTAAEIGPVPPADVAALRAQLGMTQEQFAEAFALDVATIRNWEQGRSSVDGAAAVLIKAIARAPDVVHIAAADPAAHLEPRRVRQKEPM